jgi:hypothetical protein
MGLQLLLLASLAAAATLVLAGAYRSAGRRVLFGVAALPFAIAAWSYTRFRAPGELEVVNRPVQAPGDGYTSSVACRACHPAEYESWRASYHRTMTQVAGPDAVIGDFGGQAHDVYGHVVRHVREGDSFWVEMDDPAHRGPGAPRVRRPVVMTTGSHHMQLYWFASGDHRKLGLSRLVWLVPEQRYVQFPENFLMPASPPGMERDAFFGLWNGACLRCHSTNADSGRLANGAFDTTVAELGIACESCHGRAEEHVLANTSPLRRHRLHGNDDADTTIVNPKRLSHDRSSELCGACHGIAPPRGMVPGEDFWRRYRPGEDLDATRVVVTKSEWEKPEYKDRVNRESIEQHFWPDGMVRVSGRELNGLVETPCYRRGELTCLSCHRMHRAADDPRPRGEWANDQLKPGMDGNPACVQCHEELEDAESLEAHAHHPAASSGSNCYNCHMPYTSFGLLKAIRSHQVSNPTVQESLETGRPNACNLCHLDKTLDWTARQLEAWHGTPRAELPEDERTVAASLIWSLRGDAAQRALLAWALGWEPALEASSGNRFAGRFLATLLDDPYAAVRIVAWRSLSRDAALRDFNYDFMASPEARAHAASQALEIWEQSRRASGAPFDPSSVLDDPEGRLGHDVFDRLLAARDNRLMVLGE